MKLVPLHMPIPLLISLSECEDHLSPQPGEASLALASLSPALDFQSQQTKRTKNLTG